MPQGTRKYKGVLEERAERPGKIDVQNIKQDGVQQRGWSVSQELRKPKRWKN